MCEDFNLIDPKLTVQQAFTDELCPPESGDPTVRRRPYSRHGIEIDDCWIEKKTPSGIQPGANGASNPGEFVLEYSDEFEGDLLNTNKWYAVEKEYRQLM